jgi:indole-3-acetate monooxygenase
MGGAEADPVTEMLVLESIAYHDFTSAWCTMVGATAVASLGAFLPEAGIDRVFGNGQIPTASISFFPAGRAVRENAGYRLSGRWRFNSGIRHAEWVLGGTIVEGTESENGGRPLVIFAAIPAADVTLYDNWRGRCRPQGHRKLRLLGRELLSARTLGVCLGFAQAETATRRSKLFVAAFQLRRERAR